MDAQLEKPDVIAVWPAKCSCAVEMHLTNHYTFCQVDWGCLVGVIASVSIIVAFRFLVLGKFSFLHLDKVFLTCLDHHHNKTC